MAEQPHTDDAAETVQLAGGGDLQQRERWFTASPDPWREIARLEFGGDRTFAHTVEQSVLHAAPSQWPELEARLLEALAQSDLTAAGRQFICRMLGRVGTARCVPAVAPLLTNEATADDARRALDPVDDPAVTDAYRGALSRLRGRARLGLIGSIADRRDVGAVEALTAIALDTTETREVREGAERAVERLVGEAPK